MAHGKHTVYCESEGCDQYEYEQAKAQSCQVPEGFGRTCGEPEAKACETCKELVCDQHGLYYEGVWYCFRDAKAEMDLEDSADELLALDEYNREKVAA